MNAPISKLSWKIIFKPHNTDEIEIKYEGDRINTLKYFEKLSKKKLQPGAVLALMDPKGSSIRSRHAKSTQINEIKVKKIISRYIISSVLLFTFIFLTIYNIHKNIFVSNISFILSIITLCFFIFYLVKFLKNKRKTIYLNL